MFKRSIARPSLSLYFRRPHPSRQQRFRTNSTQSALGSKPKKPESWPRFIAVRVAAVAGGYVVGKIYYYYNPKSDDSFQSYELISRDPISSTLSIFTVKPKHDGTPSNAKDLHQAWKQGIWNLQFKQPQLQILRAYTPIPLGRLENPDTNELHFLIRRDPRGEVSTYLHRLPPGTPIEMRGPNLEYPISSSANNVVFIAGGTGIAPALQVAHIMFSAAEIDSSVPSPQKKLHILWANRNKEDTATTTYPNPVLQHLNSLQHTHDQNVQISYFTDEEQRYITPEVISAALNRATTHSSQDNSSSESNAAETQVIISGPEGFISYLAGPKVWKDGTEQQGPLGGVLAQVLAERAKRDGKPSVGGKVKVWKV